MTALTHTQLLIGQMLRAPAGRNPDQTIHDGEGKAQSYRQFHARIGQLAAALNRLGLGRGATIAVMDWDTSRYLECFFAIPMIGATLHTVNIRLSPEQVLFSINHAEDDAILCHSDFLPLLLPLLARIIRPARLIFLTDVPAALPDGFSGEYETLLAIEDANFVFPDLAEDTRATLFYTTGTTGEPKGVSYSHRQLVLHTLAVAAGLGTVPGKGGIKRDDVYMPITPLFHVHGWGFPYIATFLGLKQIYPGRYESARLLSLIAEHGVTFSHCVPTILSMVLSAPEAATKDLSQWKVLIGGSALPEGLARQARTHGIDIHAAYGMSETCPFVTVADMVASQSSDDISIRTATGRAAPLVEVRVVDRDMREVPSDARTTGEVVARAPWLTAGYLKNPEGSTDLWRDGWLHTGDVGHVAPDGTLRITDRLKDVIKSGGEWVSSLTLENLASVVPGVHEVAAVGVPDDHWGERPVLVAVFDGAETTRQAILARIAAAIAAGDLPKWAAPDHIFAVVQLPRTSVGKIDKKVIRQMLTKGEIA
ncbi:fatty acid--CoA ligase [Pseudogemmobacter sp. W21_MBD1_M6]|uniref:fatty acid--CoA ligase n=1 Tax=Pseudogemmobacter sp. W21_MBD1_M6 TaxID=3240271 RepID=UPI003F9E9773